MKIPPRDCSAEYQRIYDVVANTERAEYWGRKAVRSLRNGCWDDDLRQQVTIATMFAHTALAAADGR